MINKFTKIEIFSQCVLSESTDTKRCAVCQILEAVGSHSQTVGSTMTDFLATVKCNGGFTWQQGH